ncbi:PAS domain S-box protein [bacterium]|nr:PAS domain S-box protein [bacterium]
MSQASKRKKSIKSIIYNWLENIYPQLINHSLPDLADPINENLDTLAEQCKWQAIQILSVENNGQKFSSRYEGFPPGFSRDKRKNVLPSFRLSDIQVKKLRQNQNIPISAGRTKPGSHLIPLFEKERWIWLIRLVSEQWEDWEDWHESLKTAIYAVLNYETLREKSAQSSSINLFERDQWLKSIFEAVQTGIVMINRDTHVIIDANQTALKLIGARKDDVIGRKCHQFICPCKQNECPITDLGEKIENAECELLNIHSESIPILKNVSEWEFLGERVLINSFVDIREMKAKEAEVRQNEKKYRTIFENVQDVFYQTTMDGTFIELSPSIEKYTGYQPYELLGKNVSMIYLDPSDRRSLLDKLKQDNQVDDYEIRLKTKTGQTIWVSVNAHWIQDPQNQHIGLEGSFWNITERKKTELELRKLSQSISQSPASVVITDKQGRIEYVNEYFCQLTGYTQEEVLGKNPRILKAEGLPKSHYENLWNTILSLDMWIGDLYNKKKNGELYWENCSIAPMIDDSGQISHFIAVKVDITERKHMEAALASEKHLLQTLMDNIPDTIYFKDEKSRFIRVNAAQAALLGVENPEEVIGKSDFNFFTKEIANPAFQDEKQIMKTGVPLINKQERITRADGWEKWVSVTKVPIYDTRGKPTGIAGISRDITEIKKAQLELQEKNVALEEAKQRAEAATKAKSEFLANMSHEIRTPMNAILGFTEIMAGKVKNDQILHYIQSIQTSGKTLLQLINDILDLSKIEAGKFELQYSALNIKNMFREVEQIFSFKIREKGLKFQLDIDPALPEALILDEVRIRQILLNLVGNAVKFTSNGFIKLSAHKIYTDGDHSKLDLYFSVADSGIGIHTKQQKNIFNAFEQQTGQDQAKYGGTGLGLTITKRLVDMMHGHIHLQSEPGTGTVFRIVLKNIAVASVQDTLQDSQDAVSSSILFEKATILVADDNVTNRDLVKGFLEACPLTVIEAENGREAVNMAQNHHPDLILMDLKMPVMDGYTAINILKTDPDLNHIPVVILSASGMRKDPLKVKALHIAGYLRKPITKKQLLLELSRHIKHARDVSPADKLMADKSGPESVWQNSDKKAFVKLLKQLQHEYLPRWKGLKETFIIGEIESFANDISEMSNKARTDPLSKWSKSLLQQTASFDMEKIPDTLNKFPHLVKKMEGFLTHKNH